MARLVYCWEGGFGRTQSFYHEHGCGKEGADVFGVAGDFWGEGVVRLGDPDGSADYASSRKICIFLLFHVDKPVPKKS